jgi:hypothetical protein
MKQYNMMEGDQSPTLLLLPLLLLGLRELNYPDYPRICPSCLAHFVVGYLSLIGTTRLLM